MNSRTTPEFCQCFGRLQTTSPLYSVRVGLQYRALGLLENDIQTWFWIGSHAEYDRLIGR